MCPNIRCGVFECKILKSNCAELEEMLAKL